VPSSMFIGELAGVATVYVPVKPPTPKASPVDWPLAMAVKAPLKRCRRCRRQ